MFISSFPRSFTGEPSQEVSCELNRYFGLVLSIWEAMTTLDIILKSRDIPLLTKVCLVKTMAFPVVMYGCEIWTIKKVEH